MLAIFQSDSGFSFSLGAIGSIIVIAVIIWILLAPLFNWVPDLVYWLVKRRNSDDPCEHSPQTLSRPKNSSHDKNPQK